MKFIKMSVSVLFFIFISGNTFAQIVDYYVKQTGRDVNSGLDSWANAVATIQRAIEIIRDEDPPADIRLIHVGAGTYNEQLTIESDTDNVRLLGGYPVDAVDGDTQDWTVNETIIDYNLGTVVRIDGVSEAVVDGFIIRNGGGDLGGGISVDNCTSVIISHNRIENNSGSRGSGIYWVLSGGSITGNTILNNHAHAGYRRGGGGGIHITQVRSGCGRNGGYCQVRVQGNRISGNTAESSGGGIFVSSMWSTGHDRSPVYIMCNTIENNSASSGGGIYIADSRSIKIWRNAIIENSFSEYGGGIALDNVADSMIEGNVIVGNSDEPRDIGNGGGISFTDSPLPSANVAFCNIITFNRCGGEGDGIHIRADTSVPLIGSPDFGLWPAGNNCIHNNSDRDLYYFGGLPEEVWANLNYWGSVDRTFIDGRIEGIAPTHWLHVLPACPLTEASLLPGCSGHTCTVDEVRECLADSISLQMSYAPDNPSEYRMPLYNPNYPKEGKIEIRLDKKNWPDAWAVKLSQTEMQFDKNVIASDVKLIMAYPSKARPGDKGEVGVSFWLPGEKKPLRNLSVVGIVPEESTRVLSITSAEALPGTQAAVQLRINDALGLSGGDILIKYDAKLITVTEVKAANLVSGMSLVFNKDVPGELRISIAGVNGIPSGSGSLSDIKLTVSKDAKIETETALELDNEATMYDELGSVIPIRLENSILKIKEGIKGDVNKDGKIRADDATVTQRIGVELLKPSDYQQWAADMNDDGEIKANDAIRILRKSAGPAAVSGEKGKR